MKTVAILGLILSYRSSGGLLTGGAIACLTHGPLGPSRPALPSCSSLWETARDSQSSGLGGTWPWV